MAYAQVEDVANRFPRPLDEDETRVVTTRLEDAERIIRSRIPDLDARIESGALDEGTVIMVEAEMILRLIRNPEGYQQEADGNYSYSLSQQVASGVLEVPGREWALLGIRGGVFTIRPYLKMPWEAP